MKTTFYKAILNALFPSRCIFCNDIITPDVFFCKYCVGKIENPVKARCLGCGLPVKKCECKEFIYHFDSVISPFYNYGYAQQGYYHFKFDKDLRAGEYYSDMMADAVTKHYHDIKFDFITSVCPSKPKTEFDHTGILAKNLSERLGLKYIETLKLSGKKKLTQRKLSINERFENVHNAYVTIGRYNNKRILLVDDIKTSGATIDECARKLKFAGAKSVHCITALVGYKEKS